MVDWYKAIGKIILNKDIDIPEELRYDFLFQGMTWVKNGSHTIDLSENLLLELRHKKAPKITPENIKFPYSSFSISSEKGLFDIIGSSDLLGVKSLLVTTSKALTEFASEWEGEKTEISILTILCLLAETDGTEGLTIYKYAWNKPLEVAINSNPVPENAEALNKYVQKILFNIIVNLCSFIDDPKRNRVVTEEHIHYYNLEAEGLKDAQNQH